MTLSEQYFWKEGPVKEIFFLLQVCQTQTSYNSDPGHRYRLRVVQEPAVAGVNSQRQGQWYRTATPAIVLKIVVGHVPYIAIVSLEADKRIFYFYSVYMIL